MAISNGQSSTGNFGEATEKVQVMRYGHLIEISVGHLQIGSDEFKSRNGAAVKRQFDSHRQFAILFLLWNYWLAFIDIEEQN